MLRRAEDSLEHRSVRDLVSLLPSPCTVVLNDTRVLPARLYGRRASGGRVEVLLLRARDGEGRRWSAFARASKALRPGAEVQIAEDLAVRIEGRDEEGSFEVTLLGEEPWALLEKHGHMPLPPYLAREDTLEDRERYQTVYARNAGAVAAPTAGLHLTEEALAELRARGGSVHAVTLHVGAGTFTPVRVEELSSHPMHAERYEVPESTAEAVRRARARGEPVVAIGTTSVRALESWHSTGALAGDTRLLIQPGYRFGAVDALLTNFHLPRSTLLALVYALAGRDLVRRAYELAVAERYRFFSYGDAMLVL